jgi:hypothetical protein
VNHSVMTPAHGNASPLAALPAGRVARIAPLAAARWLHVKSGRVWLTRTLRQGRGQAEDLWLAAGETQALPAGSEWVLEADRAAQLQLLHAWPEPRRANAASAWRLGTPWRWLGLRAA